MVSAAKSSYILNLLYTEENNTKKFWKVIQQVLPNSNQSNQHVQLTDEATGQEIPSDEVPNYLNNHFCRIGESLESGFSKSPVFTSMISDFASSFSLKAITLTRVLDVIKGIDIHKSSAIEGLTARILRDAFEALPHHLLHLFNDSISKLLETS